MAAALEAEPDVGDVRQAASLAEARTMTDDVDVAVIDLMLPDGSGADPIGDLRRDRANDVAAHRWADMSRVLEDAPLVLIENGRVLDDRLAHMKIRIDDVLESARLNEGVERLEQIKHAILERSGAISIIPADDR
jgi:hypothetical protein